MSLMIAVYSDVVCPWCHLGKKRLEAGLKLAGIDDATIMFLPYELNPDMPAEGMDRVAYLDGKFGPGQRIAIEAKLSEAAQEDGVSFDWAAIKRTPNTRKAHVLIALANGANIGVQIKGDLMTAFFEGGKDIGDEEVLIAIGEPYGLTRAQMEAAFRDSQLNAEIADLEQQAHRIGVQGVPFFIVNNRFGISGAQPAAMWAEALPQILAETAATEGGGVSA